MKRLMIIIGLILFFAGVDAQYSENKKYYDYRNYAYQEGDPVPPHVAGMSSLFIPGIGHMFSGEPARGALFLAGYSACVTTYIIKYSNNFETGRHSDEFIFLFLAGSINLLSIIDAVKVARVNNLAFRDDNKTSFRVQPYYDSKISGITIKLTL